MFRRIRADRQEAAFKRARDGGEKDSQRPPGARRVRPKRGTGGDDTNQNRVTAKPATKPAPSGSPFWDSLVSQASAPDRGPSVASSRRVRRGSLNEV